jgi:hypothetical protein
MGNVAFKEELAAIDTVYQALEPLSDEARLRIINYVVGLLDIAISPVSSEQAVADDTPEEAARVAKEQAAAPKYKTFAELFDAAAPSSASDRALVAGYWVQVCGEADHFDSFTANTELKTSAMG